MFVRKNIITAALLAILTLPNILSVVHIFSHEHKHEICNAVGEKHFHKLSKKCCDIVAQQTTSAILQFNSYDLQKAVFYAKIETQKPNTSSLVFIKLRLSRAPPKNIFS